MKKIWGVVFISFLVAFMSGCTFLGDLSKKFTKSSQKGDEVQEENMDQAYLQRGKAYETDGDLVEAMKQYQLALTVNPTNQEAIDNKNRLETKMRVEADRRFQLGLSYRKKGKYDQARREFLSCLRLWPDHPQAKAMLTSSKRIKAKRYVIHTIKPGQSLSVLAKTYYGDYHKYPLIAEFNGLPDATKVDVGQKIKVPEIEGVPFFMPEQDEDAAEVTTESSPEDVSSDELSKEKLDEDEEEPVDVVSTYLNLGTELFNNKKYEEAIVEFTKVVNTVPDDAVALEFLCKSHFLQGMDFYNQEEFLLAQKEFESALTYDNNCGKCREYATRSEETFKKIHYEKGNSFFNEQLLQEAVKEWTLVHEIDPDYKDVKKNLDKAKLLLKRLQEIREAQGT